MKHQAFLSSLSLKKSSNTSNGEGKNSFSSPKNEGNDRDSRNLKNDKNVGYNRFNRTTYSSEAHSKYQRYQTPSMYSHDRAKDTSRFSQSNDTYENMSGISSNIAAEVRDKLPASDEIQYSDSNDIQYTDTNVIDIPNSNEIQYTESNDVQYSEPSGIKYTDSNIIMYEEDDLLVHKAKENIKESQNILKSSKNALESYTGEDHSLIQNQDSSNSVTNQEDMNKGTEVEFVEYNSDEEDNINQETSNNLLQKSCYTSPMTSYIPSSNQIQIIKREKPISALHIDYTCSKIAIGDHAASIRLFDLNTIDLHFNPYRELDNWIGSYKLNQVKWNNNAELLLVIPDRNTPKIFTKEGKDKGDFKAGDPYIVEKQKVKGHTAAVKCGEWHPWKHTQCITGSIDGTLRFWNSAGKFRTSSDAVIKVRSPSKQYDPIYSCTFKKRDGEVICLGTASGSHFLYPTKGPYLSPIGSFHQPRNQSRIDHSITSLEFSDDGHTVVSRSVDHTLKIFDIRQFNQPVKEFDNLPCMFEETDTIISPDDKYILTGTSCPDDGSGKDGELVVIEKDSLNIVYQGPVPLCHGGIIRLHWAERINQIFISTSQGELVALYDENMGSKNGVLRAISKGYKKKEIRGHARTELIITPLQYEVEISEKLKQQRKLENQFMPRPKRPSGPGFGGQIGVTQSQTILKKLGIGAVSEEELRENPRDAILKYAKEAAENPKYIAHAYKNTQPVPVLDIESSYKEHEEQTKKTLKRSSEDDSHSRFAKQFKRHRTNDFDV